MNLVIATRNRHKLEEIRAVLNIPGIVIRSALDYPELPDVIEDGATLEANAVKKALAIATVLDCWALADDSGLEVRALNMAPGVFSARYAGEPTDDQANNRKLLAALENQSDRAARFRTVLALAGPGRAPETVEGVCEGTIGMEERGAHGFGYDPLFVPDGYTHTFAEMGSEEKNRISHRAAALKQAHEAWSDLLTREAR